MTTTTVRTIDAPAIFGNADQAERMDTNMARAYAAGLEPCATCGRGVKDGSGWLVTVTDGGAQLVHPDDTADAQAADPAGFMGEWLLGPECGKRVPHDYRVRA